MAITVTYAKPAANPGVFAAAPAAIVAPYASTYNAHVVNHAVTAPVVSSAYVASPYVASPYLASPYSAYYGGFAPASYVF